MTYIPPQNVQTIKRQAGSIDSFGRDRVSLLASQFNLTQLKDNSPLFVHEIVNGTATSVHSAIEASTMMTTSADGDYVIRQTKRRFHYLAGKSQIVLRTHDYFQPEVNIEKETGYFSSSTAAPYTADIDGLYLSSESGVVSINVRKSGTLIQKKAQSEWSIDKLDGTGPSGVTIDWQKSQIFILDFQYLGVGHIRWFVSIETDEGENIIHFHTTKNANLINGVFMSSPNQPLRCSIRQTGPGSGQFREICAAVSSEGSLDDLGFERSINNGVNHVNADTPNTAYAILGMKLKDAYYDAQIILQSFTVMCETADRFLWELRLNPIVAGTFTYIDETFSPIQAARGATLNTVIPGSGILLPSGYNVGNASQTFSPKDAMRLGRTIDGVMDELVLVATPKGSNADISGSFVYKNLL